MRGYLARRSLTAVLIGAVLFFQVGPVSASPQSEQLIRDGAAKLTANDLKAALDLFIRAAAADPADGPAEFFQGYVLNRLGQPGPAYTAFEAMRKKGTDHPEAAYEEGWAAVATGRWQRAITLLEPYEKANPNNGKASEFLGRAYMAVRRYDDADAALNRAMERDPGTKPSALYFLAQVETLRGEPRKAGAALVQIAREAPTSPVGVAIKETARRQAVQQDEAKPWMIYVAPAFGYNDNVLSLSGDIVQPSEISHTASGFFQLDAGGEYRFKILPESTLTGGYAVRYDNYFDVPNMDSADHTPYLVYRHAVFSDVVGSLLLSGEYLTVGGSRFRDGITVRPSVIAQTPVENLGVEVFYSFSDFDYKAPSQTPFAAVPQDVDRDSTVNSVGLRAVYDIPEAASRVDGGLARIWNSAKGGDFDYKAFQVSVGVTSRLPWELTGALRGSFTNYTYQNLNSLAPLAPALVTGFGFAREDKATTFEARLSRPVWGPASGFLQYDWVSERSNIAVYQFSQQQVMGGLLARF